MFSLRRPSDAIIATLRAQGAAAPWSYPEACATRDGLEGLPAAIAREYTIDRNAVVLGTGRALFERAATAVLAWRCFEIGWLELHGAQTPAHVGHVVVSVLRTLGVWAVNPCRVVYMIEESDRTGFAYGTLAGHVERGEERFLVTHDRDSDRVTFEILAFSRPDHVLVRIGKPYARMLQRRFARSAMAAMARCCAG